MADMKQASWQQYESAKVRPKPAAAARIEALTEGAILVADWAETDEERAVRHARTKLRTVRSQGVAA